MSEVSNQVNLNMLQLSSQLVQEFSQLSIGNNSNANSALNFINNSKNSSKIVYAVKGDSRYDEEMDADSDSIVTFNEYVKYLSEQKLGTKTLPNNLAKFTKTIDSETGLETVRITDIGKSIRTYLNNYLSLNFANTKISTKV